MGYAGMGIIHPSTAPGDVSVNTVVDRSSTLLASTRFPIPLVLGVEQVLGEQAHLRNSQNKGDFPRNILRKMRGISFAPCRIPGRTRGIVHAGCGNSLRFTAFSQF